MSDWLLLFVLGFFVSTWNSSVGPTGGALIAGTSVIIPPPGSLLLQGFAAIFSNGFRSFKMKKYLDKSIIYPFVLGSFLAIPLAYLILLKMSGDLWLIIIGVYSIAAALFSFYKKSIAIPLFQAGFISSIASFLTGTGSLIAAPSVRRYAQNKHVLIANESLIVLVQGFVKTIFLVFIFSFPANFFFLLSALLLSMIAGNLVGLRLLEKIPNHLQGKIQMVTVVILGLILLFQGLF